jgi:hypothetical protein
MNIVRSNIPKDNFTIVRNSVLRDVRLSFRARGVLIYLLSHVNNWRTDAQCIAANGLEGRQAVLKALQELKTIGYMKQSKKQEPGTGRWFTETLLFDASPSEEVEQNEKVSIVKTNLETAKILVGEHWSPNASGVSAQPKISVIKITAAALDNGVNVERLSEALKFLAGKGNISSSSLTNQINKKNKKITADQKVDWSAYEIIDGGIAL